VKTSEVLAVDSCYTKRGDFVARSIAGELILVPIRTQVADLDSIFNLNEVGMFIWGLLDGKRTLGQIADAVSSEFEVTRELAELDTLEFIAVLEAAGLAGPAE